jgi:hypothetical protein
MCSKHLCVADPNSAPIVTGVQSVVTLSTTPVVIAPLMNVDDNYDNADLLVVNITTPKYGTVKFLSCCNKVEGTDRGKNIADYM